MQQELFIKMVLDAWSQYIKRTDDLFNELSDEQLSNTVSAGRNSGRYLLGHLATTHDRMIAILGFGAALRPELYKPFAEQPDGEQVKSYSIAELKAYWKDVNNKLSGYFNTLKPEQWFERHNSVSEEDFKKDPHRNKLNIIINRTNHLASHYGQLLFLKPRKQ